MKRGDYMNLSNVDMDILMEKVMEKLINNKEEKVPRGNLGVFADANEAIEKAYIAQKELVKLTLNDRKKITNSIKETLKPYVEELAESTVKESKMGRYEDKIIKIQVAIDKTPSIEDLTPSVITGDTGMALMELSPFGVIGSITPSTNPAETVINNAIGMIAAGNSVVFSPHPGAYKVTNRTVELINEGIIKAGGPENLVVTFDEPSMDKVNTLLSHEKINMLVATGGPGVVNSVLTSGKKAIGAGAGNPPVVVDETADIEKAVIDIVDGASFDNNLLCTAEKEALVVSDVYDYFLFNMKSNPKVYLLEDLDKIRELEELILIDENTPNKKFTGKDASYILKEIGIDTSDDIRLIVLEADFNHPFVQLEMLMPVFPVVEAKNVDEAIEMAVEVEHGNRHTAICHSKNIDVLTKMAKAIQTTIFVKNAPSYAGLGIGGEGYTTFTIAGPTGEGLTSASSFARKRRCSLVDGFNIK